MFNDGKSAPEPVEPVGPRILRALEHQICELKQTANISVTGHTKIGAPVKESGQITLLLSDSQDPNDASLPLPWQQKRHAKPDAGGEAHAFRHAAFIVYFSIFVSAMRLYTVGLMLWCLMWRRAHDAMSQIYLAVYLSLCTICEQRPSSGGADVVVWGWPRTSSSTTGGDTFSHRLLIMFSVILKMLWKWKSSPKAAWQQC